MTDQLRIRRKTRYLRDMVAVLLDIGRNLIIFLTKQELMKLFYVVLQCLRDNAVADLSNILLASGCRESGGLADMELRNIACQRNHIRNINIGCKLRHDRLNQTVECRPVCIFRLIKGFLKNNSLTLSTRIVRI